MSERVKSLAEIVSDVPHLVSLKGDHTSNCYKCRLKLTIEALRNTLRELEMTCQLVAALARQQKTQRTEREQAEAAALERAAQLIDRIVFGLECCDSHQEYQEAQIIRPLADKIRSLIPGNSLEIVKLEARIDERNSQNPCRCFTHNITGERVRCSRCAELESKLAKLREGSKP